MSARRLPGAVRRSAAAAAAASLALALPLAGCATGEAVHDFYYGGDGARPASTGSAGASTRLIAASAQAADALLQQAPLDAAQPLLVATLVNLDRLDESSRLGRLLAEQVAARLVQRGLRVAEVKLRSSLLLQPYEGELLLSRDVREVSAAQDAQAVVVGTYAVSGTLVYVNLKLVGPAGNTVLAAHSYALPLDGNVRALLAGR